MAGVIVHEWLARSGGSENVVEELCSIYPHADLVCLWDDSEGRFDSARVTETWLARTPLRRSKALALPVMPLAWRHLKNHDYDWALISTHLFAHHARFSRPSTGFSRFVYVHTPARYIWNPELDVRGAGLASRAMAATLKPLDRRRAHEPASHAANSSFVRARIETAWQVESRVIHPPVQVSRIQSVTSWAEALDGEDAAALARLPATFILGASRFIAYKRLDLAIRAGELADVPVVLAGNGPELAGLRAAAAAASIPVHFVLSPSTELLYGLYDRALVYVFPAIEDFGIMPVEALAAGAPVLANSVGGTAETVIQGRTGALTSFKSDADILEGISVAAATERADRIGDARRFSAERFAEEIRGWVGASS